MQKLRSFKMRQKRNKNLADLRTLYHRWFDLLDEHKASTYWIDSSSLKNPSARPLNNDRQPVLNLLQRPASTSTFPSIGKQIQNFSKHWKKQARPNAVRSKGWKTKPAQDAICVLPWMHLHVQETGRIKLCCASKNSLPLGNAKTDRLTERFNSPQMQKVRDQMTRGIIPPECKSCFKNERTGSVSLRQFYNGTFSTLVEQIRAGEQKPELRALDLRISNACNLKCRSCSSASSSAWFSDQQALYPDRPTDRLVTLEESEPFNIQLSALLDRGLDELHLAGGEPLITDFNYRLLDRLIESGQTNTSLYYDTNLNTLTHNGRDILKLWKHFSSLHISLSLDATGAQGEYIRHGLDFERWKTNLHRLKKEVPHASLRLHIVVSVFNIATLPKHLERICAEPFVQPKLIGFTFLIGPPHLCVQILPKHLKKNIARNLRRNIVNNPAYSPNLRTATNNLIRFMNAKDRTEELDEFRRITSTLDQRRNENAWDLFPELRDILAAPSSF